MEAGFRAGIFRGALVFAVLAGGCTPTIETNTARMWKTPGYSGRANPDAYPELRIPALARKADLGICFSGGGTRAATAALGELRALQRMGILPRVRYISAVSGGAWGSAPWVFLPEHVSEETFLGPAKFPGELTIDDFGEPPADSFAARLTKAYFPFTIPVHFLWWFWDGDERYAHEMNRLFLGKPFSPERNNGVGALDRIPVYDEATRDRWMRENPHLTRDDFLVCRKDRPYFIAGTAIVRRSQLLWDLPNRMIPAELTSSYSGVRGFYPEKKRYAGRVEVPVGGGYAENAIYDGRPAVLRQFRARPSLWQVESRLVRDFWLYAGMSPRLSLPDILGATGVAPGAAFTGIMEISGVPEFNYTAPARLPEVRTTELMHTDGGAVENLGIIPLLARGVKNIIVFSNSETPYTLTDKHRPRSFGLLFGKGDGGIRSFTDRPQRKMDHVFEEEKFAALRDALDQAWRNGEPLIYWDTYRTRENGYHQIKGGQTVRICWIYLASARPRTAESSGNVNPGLAATRWFRELKDENLKARLLRARKLDNFPHYDTFLNNKPDIIYLNDLQVATLANYSGYPILQRGRELRRFLGID